MTQVAATATGPEAAVTDPQAMEHQAMERVAARRRDGQAGLPFCCLYHGGRRLAVGVAELRAILTPGPVTPLPDAPPHLLGVIHWRGEVLPLLDGDQLLGPGAGAERFLVFENGGGPVAVRLRGGAALTHVAEEEVVAPEGMQVSAHTRAVFLHQGERVEVLEVAELLDAYRV